MAKYANCPTKVMQENCFRLKSYIKCGTNYKLSTSSWIHCSVGAASPDKTPQCQPDMTDQVVQTTGGNH